MRRLTWPSVGILLAGCVGQAPPAPGEGGSDGTGPTSSTAALDTSASAPTTGSSMATATAEGSTSSEETSESATSPGSGGIMETMVVTAGPGLQLVVVDDGYNGSLASMTCVGLEVGGDGLDTVFGVSVVLGLEHDFIGDLVVKLTSPQGSVITLLSRPGVEEPADDGQDVEGDSSSIALEAPITFVDGGMTDAEQMGATVALEQTVCIDDGLCEYQPNPGAALPGDLPSLNGQDSTGVWQLCVGDIDEGSAGMIDFVELMIEQGV